MCSEEILVFDFIRALFMCKHPLLFAQNVLLTLENGHTTMLLIEQPVLDTYAGKQLS
jgi:hypothetical protein